MKIKANVIRRHRQTLQIKNQSTRGQEGFTWEDTRGCRTPRPRAQGVSLIDSQKQEQKGVNLKRLKGHHQSH